MVVVRGEKAGKTALSKRRPVAAKSGGTERFADTQGTKCEPSASGARVVQKEVLTIGRRFAATVYSKVLAAFLFSVGIRAQAQKR